MKKKAILCLLLPLLLTGCESHSPAVLARTEILPEAGAAAAETSVTAATANTNSEEITEILNTGERRKAGPTAPAKGLCLMSVDYD